jgi:integrase
MQGSKRLKSGTRSRGVWELRVEAGTDPVTGRRRQVSRIHRGGVGSADTALRDLVKDVGAGKHAAADATLARLLDDWLAFIDPDRSPTTMQQYRRIVARTIKPALGGTKLRQLEPGAVQALYTALRDRGLAPATIRQVHAILRAACHHGVNLGWLDSNPIARTRPPTVRRKIEQVPSPAQVQALIAAAEEDDPDMATLIALAAVTGARRGELLGLTWGDWDQARGTLIIERSVVAVAGELIVKPTKTHGVRVLACDDFTTAVLTRHRQAMEDRAADDGAGLRSDTPILSYDLVVPIYPDTASHYVRRLATKAGVDVHLHQLRHFAATQMVGGGHDIRTVAGRLGHADASVTLRVYAHALPERDRAAADALGAALTAG